jgi:protein O-GlcNAc transferase
MTPDPAQPVTPIDYPVLAYEAHELRTAGVNCLMAGQLDDAEVLFRAGVLKYPLDIDLRYRLAAALMAKDKQGEATQHLSDARGIHADTFIDTHAREALAQATTPQQLTQLAHTFYANSFVSAASRLFQKVATLQPDDLQNLFSLGLAMMHQGRVEEATANFQTAIRKAGALHAVHSILHLARMFEQTGPETLYEEGMRWRRLCEPLVRRRPQRKVRAGGERLRIGYFAPAFNRHQFTHFFLPALEAHDRSGFETICYCNTAPSDEVGAAVQTAAGVLRVLGDVSDERFCEIVEADEIDILVDLWGHNAGNRLMAFAAKPAPIQVSWLNYISTTGLSTFDAVLHADGYRAPGAQAWFSEPIWSVGPVIAPFRLFDQIPPSGPTPALAKGVFTFFCAAAPAKINLRVVRTWSAILAQVPNSVLELRYSYYKDPVLRRALVAMFESCGAEPGRLVFPEHATGEAFRRAILDADLVLDPFPYQGMTTSLDALAAGVPVVVFEGDHLAVRIAAAHLRACGLDELVAADLDEYVAKAAGLARDLEALSALRARVRPAFEASPFRAEADFARRLEGVYLALAEADRAR